MTQSTSEALRAPHVDEAQSAEAIEDWLVDYLMTVLKLERDRVYLDATFDTFGLDSAATVGLTGDLAKWLGIEIDPSVAYDHPNIQALAAHLALKHEKNR